MAVQGRLRLLPWMLLLLLLLLLSASPAWGSAGQCDKDASSCEFWLRVHHKMTMMSGKVALYPYNGKIFRYDVTDPANASAMSLEGVVTGDGWEESRIVVAVNDSMPGPALEVWENQILTVHVINDMHEDAVTIHWHGLHQEGTPWMDGVAFVSQCPILPGQTFTYRFKAYPSGTFWYHSHIGSQRTEGLFGALVIRKRPSPSQPPPPMEFIAVVQDYNHDWNSDMVFAKMEWGMYRNRTRLGPSSSLDGSFFSMFRFQAGLINGKGRYHDPKTGRHNGAPLETFHVTKGQRYRFRVISASALYPFRMSVDGHNLTLVASDGFEFLPVVADAFIINPGERFDFEITADQDGDSYWLRAHTLEVDRNHVAEAILRYNVSGEAEPTSQPRTCTEDAPCLVVNCPFTFYPQDQHTRCLRLDELRALAEDDPAPDGGPGEVDEFFLNFAFPGTSWTPGSVNGRAFRNPPVSALTQPRQFPLTDCDNPECGDEKVCRCAYTLSLQHGRTVQMVFLNMGRGKGWAHPVHMHGHSFHVVKMGYGSYNSSTGHFIASNTDIDCRGNPDRSKSFCNSATWSNSSWLGGRLPGMELARAIRKDTIIVPSGGYAVVRIKADNPGVWIMHCHLDLHATDGMAVLLNESFPKHPSPPPGFPVCQNFQDDIVPAAGPGPGGDGQGERIVAGYEPGVFWAVVGCLIALCVIQFLIICYFCSKQRNTESSYDVKYTNGGKANPSFSS